MGAINTFAAACGLVALGITTGTQGASCPDPNAIARSLERAATTPSGAEYLAPVAADLLDLPAEAHALPSAPPAPIGEVRLDPAPGASAGETFVVGDGARRVFDAETIAAFAGWCGARADERPNASDRDAALNVQQGRAAFAVVASPLSANERKAGLHETPVAVELFALACSAHAPLQSLSKSQMRKILTGELTDWNQLGCGAGPITVYVPSERGLAERAALAMIPGDPFATRCVALAENELATALAQPNALGVVRVGRGSLPANVKALAIDWSPATIEAFRAGAYRFGATVSLATLGAPGGAAARFLSSCHSHDGAAALARAALVAP
jgi:hypothetical protein